MKDRSESFISSDLNHHLQFETGEIKHDFMELNMYIYTLAGVFSDQASST